MSKNLAIGDPAPYFTLLDHKNRSHSLEQALQAGPVILLFYPFDQSPNCTRRLCLINELRDDYVSEGITVFGINNAQQESHAKFAQKAALTMPLLSDSNFDVARSYDALFEVGPIKVIRTTIVAIGADGRVIFRKHGDLPDKQLFIAFINSYQPPATA